MPTTLLEIGRRYRVDILAPGETGVRGTPGRFGFSATAEWGSRRRKRSRPDSNAHPGRGRQARISRAEKAEAVSRGLEENPVGTSRGGALQ